MGGGSTLQNVDTVDGSGSWTTTANVGQDSHPVLHDTTPSTLFIDTPIAIDNVVNAAEETNLSISGIAESTGGVVTLTISDGINTIVEDITVSLSDTWSTIVDISSFADGPINVQVVQASLSDSVTILHDSAVT